MNSFRRKHDPQSKRQSLVYEIVMPLDDDAGPDGLYDDCPHCAELRRKLASGEVRPDGEEE